MFKHDKALLKEVRVDSPNAAYAAHGALPVARDALHIGQMPPSAHPRTGLKGISGRQFSAMRRIPACAATRRVTS